MDRPYPKHPIDYGTPRNQPLGEENYSGPGAAVFWTIRAYAGRPFENNDALCRCVVDLLAEMRTEYGCWVGGYCLMPDHLHFVSGANEGGCARTLTDRFKGKSTNWSWKHGHSGKLWQPRAYDDVVRRAESLRDIYHYILENPVRAGLVASPEAWPWSGILDEVY